jgi:hypothetical protein
MGLAGLPGTGTGDDVVRVPGQPASGQDAGPLVSGPAPALQFPVSPGWLPEGVSRSPRVDFGDSGLHAAYEDAARPFYTGIDLWSSDRDVTVTGDGVTRQATTVNGKPGLLVTLADSVSLTWQPTPGRWLAVGGGNAWGTEAVVRRVAESLTDTPFAVPSPFELGLVPRDSELADWSTGGRLVFVATGKTEQYRSGAGVPQAVTISALRSTPELLGRGERLSVSGRPAWLLVEGEAQTLVVQISDEVSVIVQTPSAWDRADVLRLAEATRYVGGPVPPQD